MPAQGPCTCDTCPLDAAPTTAQLRCLRRGLVPATRASVSMPAQRLGFCDDLPRRWRCLRRGFCDAEARGRGRWRCLRRGLVSATRRRSRPSSLEWRCLRRGLVSATGRGDTPPRARGRRCLRRGLVSATLRTGRGRRWRPSRCLRRGLVPATESSRSSCRSGCEWRCLRRGLVPATSCDFVTVKDSMPAQGPCACDCHQTAREAMPARGPRSRDKPPSPFSHHARAGASFLRQASWLTTPARGPCSRPRGGLVPATFSQRATPARGPRSCDESQGPRTRDHGRPATGLSVDLHTDSSTHRDAEPTRTARARPLWMASAPKRGRGGAACARRPVRLPARFWAPGFTRAGRGCCGSPRGRSRRGG